MGAVSVVCVAIDVVVGAVADVVMVSVDVVRVSEVALSKCVSTAAGGGVTFMEFWSGVSATAAWVPMMKTSALSARFAYQPVFASVSPTGGAPVVLASFPISRVTDVCLLGDVVLSSYVSATVCRGGSRPKFARDWELVVSINFSA